MILNELKQITRKLLQQKVFLGINIIGLSFGLVFSILAFLFAQNEFKYDKHFANTEDVYLMACNNGRNHKMHFGQPAVFANEILNDIPEIESCVRLKWSDANLKIDDLRLKAENFVFADSAFFNFFGWDLLIGDTKNVLSEPMSIAISESKANQIFKGENPIGKVINVENQQDFTITGIFKDIPKQSHIRTDFIASLSTFNVLNPRFFTQWGWHSTDAYFKLNSDRISTVETKIAEVWNLKSEDIPCTGDHVRSRLQPFNDVYLKSGEIMGTVSAIDFVKGFTLIAAFILLISCLNFINLSNAIQSKRSIENGIKKVLGANLRVFSRQVFLEISAYLMLAYLFSLLIIKMSLPLINEFIDKELSLSIFNNTQLLLFIVLLSTLLLIVCGSLPLIHMIKAKTTGQLKGITIFTRKNGTKTKKTFYNSLIITQFAIGIVLVISSFTVNKQLKLIRQHDAGFNKEQVLIIENDEGDIEGRYNTIKNILDKYPEIESISCGSNVPLNGINNWGGPCVASNEQNGMQGCGFISVNTNYLQVIGASIKEGRDFIEGSADKDNIIITEALAETLNLENPIGVKLAKMWDDKSREIIGVVKNIEFNTIHSESLPIIFFCKRDNIRFYEQIIVKLRSENLTETVAKIGKHWKDISPDYPMEYKFMDDIFNFNYRKEIQTATFLNLMTIVAMSLCCMGLFGLSLFSINNRIKEIGVRKVNGAKANEIMKMLNKDFIKWVAIAFVIATPIAYYVMNKWLQTFAYKTTLSWWIFALAGFIALFIALATVSWQSWRAASRNPVEALRYE